MAEATAGGAGAGAGRPRRRAPRFTLAIPAWLFFLLFFAILAEVRGESDATAFGRRIDPRAVRQALTVALLAVGAVVASTLLLLQLALPHTHAIRRNRPRRSMRLHRNNARRRAQQASIAREPHRCRRLRMRRLASTRSHSIHLRALWHIPASSIRPTPLTLLARQAVGL